MWEPVVSVILPFHNASETLERAVHSIRQQSFGDWGLIAFDDGSTDGSREIVEGCAPEDTRIHVVPSEHVGIVEALRRACAISKGKYVLRMDADDIAMPDRIKKQAALMESHPDVALCGTRVTIVGTTVGSGTRRYEAWINGLVRHEDIVRELFVECPLPHPTFCIRRDAYERVGGYQDHGWPEDYDLVMRFWQAGMRLGKVPEPLLEWHHSACRLSMTDPRYSEAAFRALKRHYLFETYLRDRPVFHQWGAGEVGKRWLRDWSTPRPFAVVDIHPRKIGRKIHGYRVIAPEQLAPPCATFIVIAVGSPGARDEIRGRLDPCGYHELRDYIFIA